MKLKTALFPVVLAAVLSAAAQDVTEPAPRFVRGRAGQQDAGPAAVPAVPGARSTRRAQVEIDEGTRTLIITTDPATNLQVQEVIRALDKPVPQALIKVLFLEVTHSNDLDIGVDATYTDEDDGNRSVISSLYGVAAETRGGIVSVLQSDLELTMRALAEVGNLNVLSRPSILARNNEEATITIGQEVPFIRNSRITDDGQIINTVEYEDIGIILTVTPHIGADGLIELDVAPEISTLTGETVPISDTVDAPVFAKRSAETHVVVPSSKTVVIGGLMEDQDTLTVRKVPLLGDIPLLGWLFRRKVTTKQKTELLIFLTPTVVADTAELVRVSNRERDNAELVHKNHTKERLQRYLQDSGVPSPASPE